MISWSDSIQSSLSLARSQTYSANEVDLILTLGDNGKPIEWVEIDPEAFTGTQQSFIVFWTQKSAWASSAWTTQRTASGPSSIVQPGRWSTQSIPRMTWSTRRSCSIWSSKGSPSSTSSTSSCLARSYPHWWCWPTSCLHKVWKSIPLNQNIIPWEGDKIRFYRTIHHWGEMIPPETRTCCTEERFDRGERDECCSISCSVHDWISETSLASRLSWLVLPTHVILYYQVNLI